MTYAEKIGLLNEKHKRPSVSLLFIQLRSSLTVASSAQEDKTLNRADSSLFCRDTGSIQGRSFFFRSVPLLLSKTKHLFKNNHAVETARSNCSRSRHAVDVHLRRIRY